MYILVNKDKIIVASAKSRPSEEISSADGLRIYELADSEYDPQMIGQVLEDFELVDRV